MRYLIITVLAAMLSGSVQARGVDDIFEDFRTRPGAEYINVPPAVMLAGKLFAAGKDESGLARHIKSVRVLTVDDCDGSVRTEFAEQTARMDTGGYEEMVNVSEDGDSVRVLCRMRKNVISELIVLKKGKGEAAMIQMKGKFDIGGLHKLAAGGKDRKARKS